MLTLIIWCSGIVLELLILLRALQQKALAKYPFFYLYVASLFTADASLYLVSVFHPSAYTTWNWNAGFLNIILSAGILLEVFKHVLTPYPGAERLARTSGLLIFTLLFSFGIAYLVFAPGAVESRFTVARNLERNLLAVQAIFLGALVAVIFYYGIAMGRNLQGIILGYGLCVASTLITLAVRSFAGHSFNAAWIVIQPLCYWVSLFVWMAALWRYEPNPAPPVAVEVAHDYQSFVSGTRGRVGEIVSSVGRAVRP